MNITKVTALVLAIVMVFALCACGNETLKAPENMESTLPGQDLAPADEPAGTAAETVDKELFEKAQKFIGESAEDLIAACGEPETSSYGPSCLVQDGEDGNLSYPGFTVWTVRTAEGEIVHDVYLND